MTEIYSESFWRLFDELDISLQSAGPGQLYEIAEPYLRSGRRILDVGCRDARHLIELSRRYGSSGVGVDPVPWHVQRAQAAVQDAGLGDQVTIRLGVAEELVEEPASFDIVWCRDVIEVLPDLTTALAQMRRVLRPGGHLIVFTNLLDGPIDAEETAAIHEPLGNVVANLVESDLEGAFAAAGFTIKARHVIGTEWREYLEEREQVVSRELLRLARLRRSRDLIVDRYGQDAFRTAEASLQWGSPPVPRPIRASHLRPWRDLVPLRGPPLHVPRTRVGHCELRSTVGHCTCSATRVSLRRHGVRSINRLGA